MVGDCALRHDRQGRIEWSRVSCATYVLVFVCPDCCQLIRALCERTAVESNRVESSVVWIRLGLVGLSFGRNLLQVDSFKRHSSPNLPRNLATKPQKSQLPSSQCRCKYDARPCFMRMSMRMRCDGDEGFAWCSSLPNLPLCSLQSAVCLGGRDAQIGVVRTARARLGSM